MVELVETMLKLRKALPKAKTPHVWADGSRLTACGPDKDEILVVEGGRGA